MSTLAMQAERSAGDGIFSTSSVPDCVSLDRIGSKHDTAAAAIDEGKKVAREIAEEPDHSLVSVVIVDDGRTEVAKVDDFGAMAYPGARIRIPSNNSEVGRWLSASGQQIDGDRWCVNTRDCSGREGMGERLLQISQGGMMARRTVLSELVLIDRQCATEAIPRRGVVVLGMQGDPDARQDGPAWVDRPVFLVPARDKRTAMLLQSPSSRRCR